MSETPTTPREIAKLGPYRIPPRLKGKIARRVEREKSNMNDVVAGILAAHYRVEFTPSGKATRGISPFEQILLDVPPALRRAVLAEAAAQGDSQRNVVVRILSEALGLQFQPTGRWANRRRTSAAK